MSNKQTTMSPSNFLYSVLPSALVNTTVKRAEGPDLSHWSGYYKPERSVHKADFVITKATEGSAWVDPELYEIWNGMLSTNIRGLYHYQRSNNSWLAQANHFLKTIEPLDHQLVALDVEGINNTLNDTFFQDSYRIINFLEEHSSSKVILYTNPTLFQNYIYPIWSRSFGQQGQQKALSVPLWIAQYWNVRSPNKNPGMPKQRQSWDIYQWTDRGTGSEWGVGEKGVDLNVFNGSVEQMRSWLGMTDEDQNPTPEPPIELPPDPVPEEEIFVGKVISPTRMRIRTFPEINHETVVKDLYLYLGNIINGKIWTGNGYVWMKIVTPHKPYTGLWVAVQTIDEKKKYITLFGR